jgi:RNA polymerase sigma-70 factor, ECF subfamily
VARLSGSQRMETDVDFGTIVAAHHAEIYQYLLRVTERRADADDLSQETFLRAYRALPSLTVESNVRAWLFSIATNLSLKHFRGGKRRQRAYDAVKARASEVDARDPESDALGRELGTAIERTVAALPFKQRIAFLQRKVHGLDYDAVGKTLHCSSESARAHVFKALKKIRASLDGELDTVEGVRSQEEPSS